MSILRIMIVDSHNALDILVQMFDTKFFWSKSLSLAENLSHKYLAR